MKEQILDTLDENNQKEADELTILGIFKHIWFSPKKVFQYIHEHKINKHLIGLILLCGVLYPIYEELSLLITFSKVRIDYYAIHWKTFFIRVLFYPFIISCMIGFSALFVSFTGKWLGGKGITTSFFRVFVYSYLPMVIPINVLLSFVNLPDFSKVALSSDPSFIGFKSIFLLISMIPVFWIIFNHVKAISVVQNFTIKRSIVNYSLGLVSIALLIGLLNALIFLFTISTFSEMEGL